MQRLLATTATFALATAAFAQQTPAPIAGDEAEIVVTGQRAQLQRSIEAKRLAIGVLDVTAADEIGRLPDKNVAEAIEHLPGVGVTYDQGEGRYVAIRGVPSNLNNYTLNGIEIGNPDGTTRSLPLDIISGQLLNRIEIAKVKTADMDGQGIGGSVNLVPQTAFDFKKRFNLLISGKAGHQDLNKKVPYQADVSIAGRFGADEQFGVVLGGSYSDRDFNSEGFYPDNWRPDARFARGGVPDNIKYTKYSLDRQRIGVTGSLDWHGDHTKLYLRGVYSRFVEDEVRPRYRLDFSTAALTGAERNPVTGALNPFPANFQLNSNGLTGTVTTGTERREDLRLDYKAKYLLTGMVGGSTDLDKITLDYVGSYSRNQTLDRFPLWQFRCNPGAVNFDFSDKVYSAAPVTECTANQLLFRQYQDFRQLNVEKIWQGKVDAKYDLGGDSFIKVGGKYRDTKRSFDQYSAIYAPTAANRWSLGTNGLGAPGVCVYPNSANTDQCFFNSPIFNIDALKAFTAANLNTALIPLDSATTLTNNTIADFNLKEQVAALYLMGNFRFGIVTVTPGIRWEHTKLAVTGFRIQGTTVTPASRDNSYDDVLPSLIVRLTPTDETIFRFAYSKSLGRPEYASLSPGGTIDTVSAAPNAALSFGNPDLKPYRSDNLDATAEWYFAKGAIFSVGAFGKWVKNPIFTQVTVVANGTVNGVTYPLVSTSQPQNAQSGHIYGIEAQYQQQFTFLPGLLSGFGVQLNATLVKSKLTLPNGRTSTFPSQSKYLYGAELFYQKGPLEASIAYHNTGHSLLAIGDPAYNDQYNDDLRRLDFKASLGVWRDVRVFFEAQNLTDEPTRQYQAGNPNWLIQNERYGRTYYLGASAKF